jgi:hypothetical protein
MSDDVKNDSSAKLRSCTLRVPTIYNDFLEKTVAETQNTNSTLFLVGSAVLACLDNEKTWKDTLEDVKKHKAFDSDMKTIGRFSHLLTELNLLQDAGITQETLDHVFLFSHKIAEYLKSKKAELDKKGN